MSTVGLLILLKDTATLTVLWNCHQHLNNLVYLSVFFTLQWLEERDHIQFIYRSINLNFSNVLSALIKMIISVVLSFYYVMVWWIFSSSRGNMKPDVSLID